MCRVIFVGQSDLLLSALAIHPELDVVRAYFPPSCTQRAKLLTLCLYHSIPYSCVETSEDIEREFPPAIDLGICAFFKYLNPALLKKTRLGFINLHPAPLPDFPGRLPIVDLLLNGQHSGGVSLHWMNEYFDQGDLIDVGTFPIAWDDDIIKIEIKAIHYGIQLFQDHLPGILDGYAPRIPQLTHQKHRSIRSRFSFLWTASPCTIINHVKAFAYLGGTPFTIDHQRSGCTLPDQKMSPSSTQVSRVPFSISVSTLFFDLFPLESAKTESPLSSSNSTPTSVNALYSTGQLITLVDKNDLSPIHRTHLFPSTLYDLFPQVSLVLAIFYQDQDTQQTYCIWLGIEPRSYLKHQHDLVDLKAQLETSHPSEDSVVLHSTPSMHLPLEPLSSRHPLEQHHLLGVD